MKPTDSLNNHRPDCERKRLRGMILFVGLSLTLCGCAPLALTALSVGATMGVQHSVNGVAYKTFTLPLPEMRKAVVSTLKRMDIAVGDTKKMESGEKIAARATDREIEVQLEVISANTTRMRTSARSGLLMDAATANEIIAQTEKTLKRI